MCMYVCMYVCTCMYVHVCMCIQPIPTDCLLVEDVLDGDCKMNGSFRGALRASGGSGIYTLSLSLSLTHTHTHFLTLHSLSLTHPGSKNLITVSCNDPTITRHSHTLQANGDFDKKAWLDAFRQVVPNITRNTKVTNV